MMDDKQKQKALDRLSRIEGQVRGIRRMVEEDRYCMDILTQTRSVFAAIRGVEEYILENHLHTCVTEAIRSGDHNEQSRKMDEIMELISRIRKST
ncbi:metal-sensitive transcriptional regulator [Spirochaeta dissipatitropha]